jgi:hypothetical protein
MKSFDIISDDVWKLFDSKKENSEYNGKVSILKGNKKIIIRFNENTYCVRYLTNDIEDLINEFIVIFQKEENNKGIILDEILKDNIFNWMENINFNYHSKQFKAERYNIPFEIMQKTNNYPSKDITFNPSCLIDDDNCNLASLSNDSFSYTDSYKNNTDFASGLKSVLIEMDNSGFVTIQKFEQTSNICAVMRCFSMIEPLTNYITSPFKAKQIYNKYQSTTLLNMIRKYFLELWSETKIYTPDLFIKILEKKKNLK